MHNSQRRVCGRETASQAWAMVYNGSYRYVSEDDAWEADTCGSCFYSSGSGQFLDLLSQILSLHMP